ncbi:MAG: DNA primase [Anaerolineae bacterium]|nr:DNA primase [Anaerolineae bacterium]
MSVTDEIKARLDIVNYIQQVVPLKKSGRYFKACCPFHNEKTPSFVVNPDTQSWRCFGACAEGGDVFSFAMKYHGWGFSEALRELGKQAGIEVEPQTPVQREQTEHLDHLRGLMQTAADYYQENVFLAEAVLAYARDRRGFSDETIHNYAIGYAPEGWTRTRDYLNQLGYEDDLLIEVGLARRSDNGRVYDYFRNRLVIPIRDERGRVVGFGARALADEDQPKYLNSPQTPLFDKSHILFGLDMARRAIRDTETAVIVEGYMDVIQAHQAGFLNVVAQMGTAMTEAQLKLLVPRYTQRIVLALDSDAAGQSATMRSLEVARQTLQADYTGRLAADIRILQIPDAKDPDDLIRESPARWQSLIEGAVPVADYVVDTEVAELPQNATVQEREALARRLLPLLLASENSLYVKDNVQKLAMRLRIPERELLYWADEQERIQKSRAPRPSQSSMTTLEPPEFPPLDMDESYYAPDMGDETAPVRISKPRSPATRIPYEAETLALLLRQPDLYYQVNRLLRSLADGDESLINGPLADLNEGDFSQGSYRAVMSLFLAALTQDEMEPMEYLHFHLEDGLRSDFEVILANAMEMLRPRLRHGLSVDLGVVLKQANPADDTRELVRSALQLRAQRLRREREDLTFLLMDVQNEAQSDINNQIMLSIKAKRLIDDELKRQTRIVS